MVLFLILQFSGCIYLVESILSSPGPTVIIEWTQIRKVGDGKATSTNWINGDGQSHWYYCWETKEQIICSGECR